MYHHVGVHLTKESSFIMFLQSESANYVGMMVLMHPADVLKIIVNVIVSFCRTLHPVQVN